MRRLEDESRRRSNPNSSCMVSHLIKARGRIENNMRNSPREESSGFITRYGFYHGFVDLTIKDLIICQDPETEHWYAEHKIISSFIQDYWFSKPSSLGNKYSSYFNPITLPTVALILTIVSDIAYHLCDTFLSHVQGRTMSQRMVSWCL